MTVVDETKELSIGGFNISDGRMPLLLEYVLS